MKEVFDTLQPIKDLTGVDVDLYCGGVLVFSTSKVQPKYEFCDCNFETEHKSGIFADKEQDITYFFINSSERLTGVLHGAYETSKNYAVIISKLIEKTISRDKLILSENEKWRLYFKEELSENNTVELKQSFDKIQSEYFVLNLYTELASKKKELYSFLLTLKGEKDIVVDAGDNLIVYIKSCDMESEYSSAGDFAYILFDNIKEELKLKFKIGVGGTAANFDDVLKAYQNSAFAFSLGSKFTPSGSVYSYKEYVMIKMLSDIPKERLTSYLNSFLDGSSQEIFKDGELLDTAEMFMKNSLNISETSRNMYMHRNTLIYRLDKIENATGLNIRHFNDALVFRIITILYKLTM